MSSKSVPRIVPWLSPSEWRETRRLLFSNRIEDIRMGILQAKIWMDRGKVPTAVESTVNFLETVLVDKEYLDEFLKTRIQEDYEDGDFEFKVREDALLEPIDTTTVDDRVLRLAYNTSIIRFVNELVDRAQKNLFATSITKLADQIGLPRVFVDIRHDGTHDKMNSLELLRWAAWEALKWLEDQYWSFEDEFTPMNWIKDFNTNVHGLLDQYCEQLEKINEQQSSGSLEKSSYTRIVSQIDFLQTLPRIMKSFLISLCEYKRTGKSVENVIESIVRPLARNNWEIFYPAAIEVILERKESDSWINWIAEEIKKPSANKNKLKCFMSKLFVKFAEKSSADLFKDKIIKIWNQFNESNDDDDLDVKIKRIYSTFESVYLKKHKVIFNSVLESKILIQKRRYFEDENLDGWTVVNDNWRPCPLGTIPK